jgi:transglutaminase-like putative cysteine protease
MRVEPSDHFCNWQQDPQGNFLARLVFPKPTTKFSVRVDLVADMTVINPFDFFLEEYAEEFPFTYEPWLLKELTPFFQVEHPGPKLSAWLAEVPRKKTKTIDILVALNQRLQQEIKYTIRLEPGVQTPEETLQKKTGSCRDSAWLLVNICRHLGLAARFASGYLIQLAADQKALDGPSGPEQDFTDLHAWTEVYLPGAGWVGLDPTSGLLCGEGHLPVACTPDPSSAAPITGLVDKAECEFGFSMQVMRIHEDARSTKPYTPAQWEQVNRLGQQVDQRLLDDDVRLTMGGEPTFVSIDDMEGAEWNSAAVGPNKRKL